MKTFSQLDTFTRSYIECALWSSTDNANEQGGEPLDKNYSTSDIAPETLQRMSEDCENFQSDNREALDESGLSDERAGHDFWLNRNGHGSGFWDEGCPRASELSAASKAWGSFDLYIGDDGQIYGS